MKSLIFILALFFVGCVKPTGDIGEGSFDFTIRVVDECEYLEYSNGFGDTRVYSLTHKGNCKFCLKRCLTLKSE